MVKTKRTMVSWSEKGPAVLAHAKANQVSDREALEALGLPTSGGFAYWKARNSGAPTKYAKKSTKAAKAKPAEKPLIRRARRSSEAAAFEALLKTPPAPTQTVQALLITGTPEEVAATFARIAGGRP